MSKAFTKDEGAEGEPLIVPARAPLPPGTPNYVTPRGMRALRAELELLPPPGAGAAEDPRARAAAAAHAAALHERIACAVVVDPKGQPHDEVRFGATVTVLGDGGATRRYQIVGVDEGDVAHGRVAFVAPLARALLGKRLGDVAVVRTPRGEEELELVSIAYDEL